jgi:hypothetical protein
MQGVGAESGVKAEAVVFSGYFDNFPHPWRNGFAGLAKFCRRIERCTPKQNPPPALRGSAANPIFHASRGKSSQGLGR